MDTKHTGTSRLIKEDEKVNVQLNQISRSRRLKRAFTRRNVLNIDSL